MIGETVLLWLGTMALLTDYAGIAKADNPASETIAYLFAALFWLAFVMNSLAYKQFSGGVQFETSAQSLALIGLVATITTLVLLFQSAFKAIQAARKQ